MSFKTTRRSLIKVAGGLAAAAVASPFVHIRRASASDVLYINTWGGSWTEAEKLAFFDPFTAETGVRIETVAPVSFAKLKAQAQSGSYEWDVTSLGRSEMLRGVKEGLVEPINWNVVDRSKLPPDVVNGESIAFCVLGTNLAYRSDRFPNGGPQSWADFWNVEKFPGKRSLYNNALSTVPFALLADGVPRDQLYPLDIDRAFAALDRIKPHITVWWTQGNQSQQLIRDGEVDMIAMWNARASEVTNQGYPVVLVWNEALIDMSPYGVVKGAPNADNGFRFMEFVTRAEPQAAFANRLHYGPVNQDAFAMIPEEVAKQLPTWPANREQTISRNNEWEADHAAVLSERFAQWLAS